MESLMSDEPKETKRVGAEIDINLYDLLGHAVVNLRSSKKQIITKALWLFLKTEMTLKESMKRAELELAILQSLNGSVNPIKVKLDVATAIALRDKLNEKLEAVGIKENAP